MAADGTISIEVALAGKEKLISDTQEADKILKDFGDHAGDRMDESIKDNTDKAKRTLASFPKEVKTELIAEAKDAGIKNFGTILKQLPKEQRVDLLTKVEDGKAIDFQKLLKSLPKEVQSEVKVNDKATQSLKEVRRAQQNIPGQKETTVKANDEASAPLRRIKDEADDTAGHVSHLGEIVKGTMIGNMVSNGLQNAFSVVKNAIGGAIESAKQYSLEQQTMNATWTTLTGNAKDGQKMVDMTDQMAISANNATDMVDGLNQKFYAINHSADGTEALTKSVLTLQDAFGQTDDAVMNFGTQFAQMMANGKVGAQDMMSFVNTFPVLRTNLLKTEQQITGNHKMTMSQMNDLMSAGKISSQTMEKVLQDTAKEYGSATENFSKTIPGMTRTIKSQMPILLGAITQPLATATNPIMGTISNWVTSSKTKTEFANVGKTFSDGLNRAIGAYMGDGQGTAATVVNNLDGVIQKVNSGIEKTFDFLSIHAGSIKGIVGDTFELSKIIGGTVWSVAYDTFMGIAKAFGLVNDNGKEAQGPLETIKSVMDQLVSHKTEIQNLTKIWLAFFAVGKITSWIKTVNEARKSLMELGIVQKLFGGNNGSGISLPTISGGNKGSGAGGLGQTAETVANEVGSNKGLLSRVKGLFTSTKSAAAGIDVMDDLSTTSSMASKFSKAAGAAKGLAGIGTALTLLSSAGDLLGSTQKTIGGNLGKAAGSGLGSWAGGAATGAVVGTFAGPIGTAVGTGLGAAAGAAAGSSVGKKIGKDIQNGVESAFHPKLDDGVSKTTNKLKGGVKAFAKSYQDDMNKINGDTILLGSATGKQADKIQADMSKTYKKMSADVDAYYKQKESKSKKDLETLVSQGYITQKEADKSLAKEKKQDASRAKNMKGAYANMQKESESYFKERASLTAKWEKKASASAKEVEKERAVTRTALVAQGATKAQLAEFDAGTAKRVAKARQKATEGEQKNLEKLRKSHLKNMKSLQSQADADTYQDLKVNGGKEADLLQKLSESKQKLSQKELANVVSTSSKQTQAVIDDANKTYSKVKDAADKKYKATTSAAETEYYVNHSISKSQYDAIVSNAKHQRDDTISAAKTQRDTTVKHAKEQHKEVVDQATKQAGEHKSAVNTETGDVKSIWDRFLDNVAGVWNHLIDAWNWVGKLWGKKPSGHWKRYATGTGGTLEDQMAVVGEEGFELAHHPSMGLFPVGLHGMETTFLPAGTSILPHNKSEEFLKLTSALPHHADGVFGTISDIFDKVKKATGTIGSSIANAFGSAAKFISKGVTGAWDWIKDHVGFDTVTKNDGKKWSSMRSNYGSNTVKSIEKGFKDTFSSLFKKAKDDQDSGGNGPLKSLPELESIARRAAEIMGVSPSDQFIKQLANVAMSESGGNSGAANLTDSNAKAGMASVGLLQYIPSTWSYYNVPGHNNRSSVLDNFVHFFNNSDWQNSIGYVTYPSWGGMYKWDWKHDGPQGAPRMAMGGRYTKETPAVIGEDGTEYVVNITKTNADELLAAAIEERAQTHPESIFAKTLQNQMGVQSSIAISNGIGTLPSGIMSGSGTTSSGLPDQINKSNALLRYIIQVIKEQGQQKSGSLVANSNQMIQAIETAINRAGHQTLYSATRTGGR